jgi:hypothetical protein
MNKKYIFLGFGFCVLQLFCDASEFEKFAKKFAPPAEVQKTIEDNKNDLPWFGLVRGKDDASSVFTKGGDIARIVNAEALRTYIEEHNLTTVAVPNKWIYAVNGEWRVFAECIEWGLEKSELTLQEVQDLAAIAEKTGFRDWDNNIIINKRNGKMTLIDTEDASFAIGRYSVGNIPAHCKVQYVASLYLYEPLIQKVFLLNINLYHSQIDTLLMGVKRLTLKR